MKSLRTNLAIVLLSFATAAFAQSAAKADAQKADEQKTGAATADPHAAMNHKTDAPQSGATKSESQSAFEAVKKLAGNWEGPISNVAGENDVEGKISKVTLRETSMGHAF